MVYLRGRNLLGREGGEIEIAKIKYQISKFKTGFAPLVLVIVIGIVLAAGGLGLGLAWKAGLFGKPGGGPKDGTTTNGTQPTPPPSDGTENGEVPPPPPDTPEDWEMYTSQKREYSFKSPPGWVVEQTGPDWEGYEGVDEFTISGPQMEKISFAMASKDPNKDLDSYLNEQFGGGYKFAEIGGHKVYRVDDPTSQYGRFDVIFFEVSASDYLKMVYTCFFSDGCPASQESIAIFELMAHSVAY